MGVGRVLGRSRVARVTVALGVTAASLLVIPHAGAVTPGSAGAIDLRLACADWGIWQSTTGGNDSVSLCAVVVLGAVASSQPGAGVLYAKVGWGHSCSPGVGCTSYYREADIDQAAFDVDPTSTTATLSTTVDGCHLELGLQASPAGPTDGYTTTPWLAKDAQPSVGAGAAVLRLLFASGSGSVCNDSLGQGPVKASFIGRVQAASAIVGSDYNYGDNILADALKAVTSRAGG